MHEEECQARQARALCQEPTFQAPPLRPLCPLCLLPRVKNTAQALKTAILGEIIESRIYEEARLRALFRSYLKLNSGARGCWGRPFYMVSVRAGRTAGRPCEGIREGGWEEARAPCRGACPRPPAASPAQRCSTP